MTRKCKVCGVGTCKDEEPEPWCDWCWLSWAGEEAAIGKSVKKAAEWGAKRRAAAAKKAPPVITLVRLNDDWSGIYVDGKLVAENHSLNDIAVLRALGLPFQIVPVQLDDESLPEELPAEWARKDHHPRESPRMRGRPRRLRARGGR